MNKWILGTILICVSIVNAEQITVNHKGSLIQNSDGTATAEGKVLEKQQCVIDGACHLKLQAGRKLVDVVYDYNNTKECGNLIASQAGQFVKEGQWIKVLGKFNQAENSEWINLCGSPSYYLKAIDDSKTEVNAPSQQTAINRSEDDNSTVQIQMTKSGYASTEVVECSLVNKSANKVFYSISPMKWVEDRWREIAPLDIENPQLMKTVQWHTMGSGERKTVKWDRSSSSELGRYRLVVNFSLTPPSTNLSKIYSSDFEIRE